MKYRKNNDNAKKTNLLVPPSILQSLGIGKYIAISSIYYKKPIIMMEDGSVNVNHGLPIENLQPGNWWERFLVVSCGEKVAFYSTCHKRFLRMESDGKVNGYGGQIDNGDGGQIQLPTDWECERFQLFPEDEGRRFLIFNPHAKRFLRVCPDGGDGYSGVFDDPKTIPPLHEWGAERLILTNHPF